MNLFWRIGTCGRRFCWVFSINGLFFRQIRCTSRIVLCGNTTSKLTATTIMTKLRQIKIKAVKAIGLISKQKHWRCSTLFGRFLCCHYTTIVKPDWNGNCVILALISKIVTSSIVMLVTFISLEIPIQRINHRLAKILETVFGIVNQNNNVKCL